MILMCDTLLWKREEQRILLLPEDERLPWEKEFLENMEISRTHRTERSPERRRSE